MRLYDKFIYSILICLIHGNDLKISGPLLVDSTWDWLKSCCGSGCCGCNSCGSDCCNSCRSSSKSGEKLAEVILANQSGTGYKHVRNHSVVTYTPDSNYSINAVKYNPKDVNVEKSVDSSKTKTDDSTKGDGKEEYTTIWKTDKKEEYASKVTVEYYEGILTIYIGPNDSSKLVYKYNDNKWEEDTTASTHKSNKDGSDGKDTASDKSASATTNLSGGTTPASPTSGGTTGTDNSTGTDASADGGTQQSTPATQ